MTAISYLIKKLFMGLLLIMLSLGMVTISLLGVMLYIFIQI